MPDPKSNLSSHASHLGELSNGSVLNGGTTEAAAKRCQSFVSNIYDAVQEAQACINYQFKDLDHLAFALIDETFDKAATNDVLSRAGVGMMTMAAQHHGRNEGIADWQSITDLHNAIENHKLDQILGNCVFYDVNSGKDLRLVCLQAAEAIIAVTAIEKATLDDLVKLMQGFGLLN